MRGTILWNEAMEANDPENLTNSMLAAWKLSQSSLEFVVCVDIMDLRLRVGLTYCPKTISHLVNTTTCTFIESLTTKEAT
jgi:hypothetical protein